MAKRKQRPAEDLVPDGATASSDEYTVLARRCRPQQFREIIGQEAVAQALANALEHHRVAHAYLFTGARGVGKTSTARILAKALNCAKGPTPTPCDQCDTCRSIAQGEDVDVLEIDGASNRGIDEVREIRQNVQYRPARSRYKIYIIDEVHMLTAPAFNALLKTLEEPPAHVKFIFATTEVHRIPVTILSRCQRFDFGGIRTPQIVDHLRAIVQREGRTADDEALEIIARRSSGSMRDAQSLLDQVLAFGGAGQATLTVLHVHAVVGSAHEEFLTSLAAAIVQRDAARGLALLEQVAAAGVQLAELLDQLIDYWRDLMVASCTGGGETLSISTRYHDTVLTQSRSLSLETVLAGLDVLSTTKARLRGSPHSRVLLEMAIIRLSRLDDLLPIAQLAQLVAGGKAAIPNQANKAGGPPAAAVGSTRLSSTMSRASVQPEVSTVQKKTPHNGAGSAESHPIALTPQTLHQVWAEVLRQIGPFLASNLEKASGVAITGPKTLVLHFDPRYNHEREHCQEPARMTRTEEALRRVTGDSGWNIRIESAAASAAAPSVPAADADQSISRYRRQRTEAMQAPLVKRASEVLGAQIVHMDEGFGSAPSETPAPAENPETEGN